MWSTAIAAIGAMMSEFFSWQAKEIERQSETDVIKAKKDYKRAVEIAETLIGIAERYKDEMTFRDRVLFCRLIKNFKKYN